MRRLIAGASQLPLLGSNQDSPDPESGVLPVTPRGNFYGAEGDRTPDLCSAIAALSQLSYSPVRRGKLIVAWSPGQTSQSRRNPRRTIPQKRRER